MVDSIDIAQYVGTIDPWKIVVDEDNKTVMGYLSNSVTMDKASKYSSTNIATKTGPVVQWTSGDGETATLNLQLFKYDRTISIVEDIEYIKSLVEPRPKSYLPPRVKFMYDKLTFEGYVESVGGCKYEFFAKSGKIKSVEFTIKILKYTPYDIKATTFNKNVQGSSTRYIPVSQRDLTFESISIREYGSTNFGIVLKKANLANYHLKVGDMVRLPPVMNLYTYDINPYNYFFQGKSDAIDLRNQYYEMYFRKFNSNLIVNSLT